MKKFLWLLVIVVSFAGCYIFGMLSEKKDTGDIATVDKKATINIWYTDEALTDYINSAALSYYEDNGVRVVPVLRSELSYTEDIYTESVSDNDIPDLYIIGSDQLEEVIMAGDAVAVNDARGVLNDEYFPETALNAVTYKGQSFAYPMYYETAYLLYNKSFLDEMADGAARIDLINDQFDENSEDNEGQMEDVSSVSAGSIPDGFDEDSWAVKVAEKSAELVPESIEDILAMAESYSAPTEADNFFVWDVSDIFYNYFFAGAYMNAGGECGDDESIMDINSSDVAECLTIYQQLNQFFYIDSLNSSYDHVLNDFIAGKTIFTIATSDAIGRLDNAIDSGEFTYEYGVAMLPGVDSAHKARGLSRTSGIVVNAYSKNRGLANDFAAYLSVDCAKNLYTRTSKLPATDIYKDELEPNVAMIYDAYENSVSLPKLMELSNFWMELENTYMLIWDGQDVSSCLDDFATKISEKY